MANITLSSVLRKPEPYGVAITRAAGIVAGGYYAERSVAAAGLYDSLHIRADGAGTVVFSLRVGGAIVYGPTIVTTGVPITVSNLNLLTAIGDEVSIEITSPSAGVTDLWARLTG